MGKKSVNKTEIAFLSSEFLIIINFKIFLKTVKMYTSRLVLISTVRNRH